MSPGTDPVKATAMVMCIFRALECEREVHPGEPEKLFSDPLAELLADSVAIKKFRKLTSADKRLAQFVQTMHVRTRFFDDKIAENLDSSSQVVLLGSGFDARAYRLGLKEDVTYYEVDQAEMNEYKNNILCDSSPKCGRVSVDADLSKRNWVEKLVEAGFNKDISTVWILEGLIYYFSENEVDLLMKSITANSGTGSVFAIDIMNTGIADADHPWSAMWKFGVEDPEQFLSIYGWSECSVKFPSEIARERGFSGYEYTGKYLENDQTKNYWFACAKME